MSYTCSDLLRRRGFATLYMTHGIAFLRRFADAAFSTNFTENGGIIKNILCFEQTENKQALLKASGEKAEFRVFMDGKFIYDFRGYEGQACQKDIQPFLNDLEEVYGLHVTKTQEIWSNPDKISSMKYQTVKTNTNKR